MALIEFTPQQIESLNDFLSGGNLSALTDGSLKYFFTVSDALKNKLLSSCADREKVISRQENTIQRLRNKKEKEFLEGNFVELGWDSLDLAYYLLYCLQQLKTYRLSKTKVVYLLFEAYSSWLASKGEKICIECPVATPEGPWFWRVSNRININEIRPFSDVEKVKNVNPGLAKFLGNVARKYYDYSDSQLKAYFCKQSFYKEAKPEKNNGKWNKILSDTQIYSWKKNEK